ncbi:hypothetical protein Hanom_Chr02g00164381 [Helianthus anomalus]
MNDVHRKQVGKGYTLRSKYLLKELPYLIEANSLHHSATNYQIQIHFSCIILNRKSTFVNKLPNTNKLY